MKKIVFVILILIFGVSVLMPATAFADPQKLGASQKSSKGIVDVGNKICPVTGAPVSGKDFVNYKGKRYSLCCKFCKKAFLKEPTKYIAKLNTARAVSLANTVTTANTTSGVEPILDEPTQTVKVEGEKIT